MSGKFQLIYGCLLGGAYGDSLGAAVEFYSSSEIFHRYGTDGITRCDKAFNQKAGVVTDDTQMAIATIQGLLKLNTKDNKIDSVWKEYLKWYEKQNKNPSEQRAPGNTCMSALSSGKCGTINAPPNKSSGCGAIMRAHPIGLMYSYEEAFEMGKNIGLITHGHPNGYIPAGVQAALIALLISGKSLHTAITIVLRLISTIKQAEGTKTAILRALKAEKRGNHSEIIDTVVGDCEGGFLGHNALSIALYSLLCAPEDAIKAVQIAVNHSGDSDSTGSIAGALAGAMHGHTPFTKKIETEGIELEKQDLIYKLSEKIYKLTVQ